jgi:hypothetical protein
MPGISHVRLYAVHTHFVGFAHTTLVALLTPVLKTLVGLLTRIMFGGFARQCQHERFMSPFGPYNLRSCRNAVR